MPENQITLFSSSKCEQSLLFVDSATNLWKIQPISCAPCKSMLKISVDLANTAVTPGTYGDSSHVGQFTVDQQGRITSAQNVFISALTPFVLTNGSGTTANGAAVDLGGTLTSNATILGGGFQINMSNLATYSITSTNALYCTTSGTLQVLSVSGNIEIGASAATGSVSLLQAADKLFIPTLSVNNSQTEMLVWNSADGKIQYRDISSLPQGTVTSVSGTANRIISTGGTTPVIDISAAYVGQTSIITLGTVTTGTWSTGAVIAGATMTLGGDAANDIYYRSAGGVLTRLANGTTGKLLTATTGSAPSWVSPATSGTVTTVSVTTNQGVSGVVATATTTPAITLSLGALTGVTSINGLVITANTGVVTTGTWSATAIAETKGGTNQTSYALGDILFSSAANTLSKLAGNITGTRKFLRQDGTGVISSFPTWSVLISSDIPDLSATYYLTSNPAGYIAITGVDKQVFFNDGGSLGADSGLTYDKVAASLLLADGTMLKPSYAFNSASDTGVFYDGISGILFSAKGNSVWGMNQSGVLYPAVDCLDIGIASTNRIGTIYMCSSIDYVSNMKFTVSGTDKLVIDSNGKISNYNGSATAGWGVFAIYGSGRSTARTAATASVATYTVGASDGSFYVSANVLVTTATLHNFTVTVAYTDEGNTARTVTMQFSTLAGAFVTAITNAQGTVPYEGVPLHIRCKAATAITVATTGAFTTVAYNVESTITQIS